MEVNQPRETVPSIPNLFFFTKFVFKRLVLNRTQPCENFFPQVHTKREKNIKNKKK